MLSGGTLPSSRFLTKPLYLQLRDALAERIAKGQWRPGGAIPNEGDLAREFGVSSGTMRKALDLMEGERLLTRRQGRGTFVNDQSSAELAARFCNIRGPDGARIACQVKVEEVVEAAASDAERGRLGLGARERVFRFHRASLHNGRPFMVEEVAVPAVLFPGLAEKRDVSHRIVALAQEYGILPGKAEERTSVGLATPAIAKALGIAPDAPIMLLDRVVIALDGRPIEWRVGQCHLGDRYYFAEMQ